MRNVDHSDGSEDKMGQKKINASVQVNMTAWMYDYTMNHMSKESSVYSSFMLDMDSEVFKRNFVIQTTAVRKAGKKTAKTVDNERREKKNALTEHLERYMTLCPHNSFFRLPGFKQRVAEQKI